MNKNLMGPFFRNWVNSDVIPANHGERSENVTAVIIGEGGSVEFGLLTFCSRLDFGLGTREKCYKG